MWSMGERGSLLLRNLPGNSVRVELNSRTPNWYLDHWLDVWGSPTPPHTSHFLTWHQRASFGSLILHQKDTHASFFLPYWAPTLKLRKAQYDLVCVLTPKIDLFMSQVLILIDPEKQENKDNFTECWKQWVYFRNWILTWGHCITNTHFLWEPFQIRDWSELKAPSLCSN